MLTVERAITYAVEAHFGQKDKSGRPYILHPLHVMMQMETDTERVVAILHDVTEDSECTLKSLHSSLNITEEIHNALFALDKNNFEDYMQMIIAIKMNPIARKVKIADLEHNMDIRRVLGREQMDDKDKDRMAKYFKAWSYLKGE